jgi:hypothetical protein
MESTANAIDTLYPNGMSSRLGPCSNLRHRLAMCGVFDLPDCALQSGGVDYGCNSDP